MRILLKESDRIATEDGDSEVLVECTNERADERPVLRERLRGDEHEPGVRPAHGAVALVENDEVPDVRGHHGALGEDSGSEHLIVRQAGHRRVVDDGHDVVATATELVGDRTAQHLVEQ